MAFVCYSEAEPVMAPILAYYGSGRIYIVKSDVLLLSKKDMGL
jgi:hypothetical protein